MKYSYVFGFILFAFITNAFAEDWGIGYGNSRSEACREAKADAKRYVDYWKPRGGGRMDSCIIEALGDGTFKAKVQVHHYKQ